MKSIFDFITKWVMAIFMIVAVLGLATLCSYLTFVAISSICAVVSMIASGIVWVLIAITFGNIFYNLWRL